MSYSDKIYPEIPSAPHEDEGHIYRLKKIDEMNMFLEHEIILRDKLYKQQGRMQNK